jgi:hypothetical protein
MFTYQSTEIKSISNNSSKRTTKTAKTAKTARITRRNNVVVHGNKGTKSVAILNSDGKEISKKVLPLTQNEIKCIRRNEFIPGLFKDCSMRPGLRKTRRLRK